MGDGGEALVRLGVFAGVFAMVVAAETVWPFRAGVSRGQRWVCNVGLSALNTLVVRVLAFGLPVLPVVVAAAFEGGGLFGLAGVPWWIAAVAGFVILDLAVYVQHVVFHHVPALWRLHRVHHADPDYDLTTGARFHPLEILLSMLIKFAAIVVIGPSVLAVIVFEVVLNATAMFNHGNVRLPLALDRILRLFVVTPDMHRVHHSVEDDEANSNFGFNLPWWDLLFGTYRDQPRNGHTGMRIGIRDYTQPREVSWLPGMLLLPFRGRINRYAINRRPWTTRESANDQ